MRILKLNTKRNISGLLDSKIQIAYHGNIQSDSDRIDKHQSSLKNYESMNEQIWREINIISAALKYSNVIHIQINHL